MSTAEERPAFVDTPEFRDAVSRAAQDAAKDAVAAILAERAVQQAPAPSLDFANSLATAIATLTHQGQGRGAPVSPEVMNRRSEARTELMGLLIDAEARGIRLSYQLKNKVYLDYVLVQPVRQDPVTKRMIKTEIDWPGIPNEAMIPMNEAARQVFDVFLRSIGSVFTPAPTEPMRFTAKGLVINGAPTPTQEKYGLGIKPDDNQAVEETGPVYQGLRIHGNRNADYKPTRVMGTIAEPALETV